MESFRKSTCLFHQVGNIMDKRREVLAIASGGVKVSIDIVSTPEGDTNDIRALVARDIRQRPTKS